jgi:hypothetical protein
VEIKKATQQNRLIDQLCVLIKIQH